jgi:hypothetical protein
MKHLVRQTLHASCRCLIISDTGCSASSCPPRLRLSHCPAREVAGVGECEGELDADFIRRQWTRLSEEIFTACLHCLYVLSAISPCQFLHSLRPCLHLAHLLLGHCYAFDHANVEAKTDFTRTSRIYEQTSKQGEGLYYSYSILTGLCVGLR